MSTVPYVQEAEFKQLIQDEQAVVVDITAPWCGPCQKISPLMDQLAADYTGRVKVAKLDIDQNKRVAREYGIRSIPAVLVFQSGKLVETLIGVNPYADFTGVLDQHL